MNQQGLLADKKREGRCSGDYFVLNACEIHFSGFIEALDSKGILRRLKKVLRAILCKNQTNREMKTF